VQQNNSASWQSGVGFADQVAFVETARGLAAADEVGAVGLLLLQVCRHFSYAKVSYLGMAIPP
jgi:hypothetical protein